MKDGKKATERGRERENERERENHVEAIRNEIVVAFL